jgi:ribosomal protein S18 acetylase RimI-like enzyme
MQFREAKKQDIEQMHQVRIAVKENPLPDPDLISSRDYEEFLFKRGKGWVCEEEGSIVGFAIVDLEGNNIWALFIQPGCEGRGIGKKLHDEMISWYFSQTDQPVWLGTAPNTRAEGFYEKAGWKRKGMRLNGEIKFEMTINDWHLLKSKSA